MDNLTNAAAMAARDTMEKLRQQYGPGAPDEGPPEGEGTHDNPL